MKGMRIGMRIGALPVAAALLLAGSSACYRSFPEEGEDGRDAGADADADRGRDADDGRETGDGSTVEECPPSSFPAGDVQLRLRHLDFLAPEAMRNALLRNLVTESLDNGYFLWLMRFSGVESGSVTLTTGAGMKIAGLSCSYRFLAPDYPPDSLALFESGLDFEPAGWIATLFVPMWSEGFAYPDPPLMVLPLRELEISGTFDADHLGIGSFAAVTGEWSDGGMLVGKITVPDANATVIDPLGLTLCGLISGAVGAPGDPSDDCVGDPSTWLYPPDTTVGAEPAYDVSATFSASAVHILP